MTDKASICIILDRSGSMESCRSDAIGAVNSYLRQIRDDETIDATVSVIIFDSESIDCIRDRRPASTCPPLEDSEYEPRSMTPLLDAVARGVSVLSTSKGDVQRRILVVMTDGLENASREHTRETIADLLKRKQDKEGWLIVYLGADHEAWEQARHLGIQAGNTANLDKASLRSSGDIMYALSGRYMKAGDIDAAIADGFTDAERSTLSGKTPRDQGSSD
jgi:hypothetical protein